MPTTTCGLSTWPLGSGPHDAQQALCCLSLQPYIALLVRQANHNLHQATFLLEPLEQPVPMDPV